MADLFTRQQQESEVDRGLPAAIVAIAAIPLILFGVFLVGQIGAAKPQRPIDKSKLVDVKPDSVYRQLPVAEPSASAPAAGPNIIYFAPTSAQLPVPLSMPEPAYTDDARTAQVQGPMKVLIKIGAAGNVSDPQVLTPLGHGLEERALRAVINWRFQPARLDGKPIGSSAYVDVHFK